VFGGAGLEKGPFEPLVAAQAMAGASLDGFLIGGTFEAGVGESGFAAGFLNIGFGGLL
jgi:hypothetical protein